MSHPSAVDRFASRVNKLGPVPELRPDLGRCWEWLGEVGRGGYGRISVGGARRAAHRFSWELVHGPLSERVLLDHACHNRGCVNPSHVRPASKKENAENRAGAQANNATGILGVSYIKSRGLYEARVGHNGKRFFAGYHGTNAAAKEAATTLRNKLFTHNDLDNALFTKLDTQEIAA